MVIAALVGVGPPAANAVGPAKSTAATQTFTTAQSTFPADGFGGGGPNQGQCTFVYTGFSYCLRGPYAVDRGRIGTDNYFTFDLRSSCVASGATLQLTRGTEFDYGYREGPADYAFREVTTPAEVVNVPGGSPFSAVTWRENTLLIFFDLEDGPSYGGGEYPIDGSPSDLISFPLNPAGVAAFNTARGDFFTLGGSGGGRGEYLANASFYRQPIFYGVSDPAKLVVTCALPTDKAQCKKGGWKTYGVFKNQGDCVSFIATGGKNGPAKKPG